MNKTFAFSLFAFSSVFAHYNEPGVELVFDNALDKNTFTEIGHVHLSLFHQTSFELENDHVVLIHLLSNPYNHKKHHSELGIGYRKIFENWGFGLNYLHAVSNVAGVYNHQLCPGLEFNFGHFDIVLNRYFPLQSTLKVLGTTHEFHRVTELCVSYKPSNKFELSIAPYFNQSTKKFGFHSEVSAYVFDEYKISLKPFYTEKQKIGLSMSLGYHFGGAKTKVTSRLKKTHRFFSTASSPLPIESPEPVQRETQPDFPYYGPMVVPPPTYEIIQDVKPEEPMIIPKPEPEKKPSWYEWLFFWSAKPK